MAIKGHTVEARHGPEYLTAAQALLHFEADEQQCSASTLPGLFKPLGKLMNWLAYPLNAETFAKGVRHYAVENSTQ